MRLQILATATLALTTAATAQAPGAPDVKRVAAGTYAVDPNHTQVVFQIEHLGFNSYYGTFGGATGTLVLDPARPAAATVEISVPIDLVVTTSEKLNTHLKAPDFFDAAKFPTATFKSTRVTVSGTTAKIAGTLTVRGVSKPVVLDAKFTGAGTNGMSKAATVGFEATTTVSRSAFGVSYLPGLLGDKVPLRITAAFEKK